MDADQQVYDDNGKPIPSKPQVYDDNGKPITASAPTEQRGLLSGLEDMYHGLINNMSKSADASSSPAGFQRFGERNAQTLQNTVQHPLKTVAGALGFNPDTIYTDYQNKNYGGLAGDVVPPVAMLGLVGLLHGAITGDAPIGGMDSSPKVNVPDTAFGNEGVNPTPVKAPITVPLQLPEHRVAGYLPAIGETNSAPRFYAGPAGIADARLAYPYDIQDPAHPAPQSISSGEPGVQQPNDIGPIAAANRTSLDIKDPAQLNPAFRALVPERYSGIKTKPLGLQGFPKEGAVDVTQVYPYGGKVVDKPAGEYDPNKIDVVNRQLSQHEPENIANIIDSNPQTRGQRPIPDIVNSTPVDPVVPSDITMPRAGMASPTVDVNKWVANIKSADKILDSYESTAPISSGIRGAQDRMLPFMNSSLKQMEPLLGNNATENTAIFNALDGKLDPATLSPDLQQKVSGLRQQLDAIHAGIPGDVGYLSDYITHMREGNAANQTLWGYFFGKKPIYDPLQPGTPSALGDINNPFTEQRTGALQDYSTDLPKVLRAYVSSIARTKFMDPAVTAAKEQLTSIPDTLPKVKAVADAYIRNVTHYNAEGQLAKEYNDWANAVANTYTRSYLDWNVPLHMLHLGEIPSSVFPELGSKYTTIGARKFAMNPAATTREIASNGLLQNSVVPPAFQTVAERWQTAANFWNVAEAVTKGIAYNGAKARALDMGMSESQAVMKAIADTKDMTYTVDPSRMAKGLTSQSNIAGGQIASRVGQQFKGVPLKIVEQYSNIIKNTFDSPQKAAQTARLLFGAGLAATGTVMGAHTLHMNPSNLLKPTVLGPFGDFITTVGNDLAKGDLAGAIGDTVAWVTPGGQQLKKVIFTK